MVEGNFFHEGTSGELEIFCREHGLEKMLEKLAKYNCGFWVGLPPIEKINARSGINLLVSSQVVD